jgi:hypothetical protein
VVLFIISLLSNNRENLKTALSYTVEKEEKNWLRIQSVETTKKHPIQTNFPSEIDAYVLNCSFKKIQQKMFTNTFLGDMRNLRNCNSNFNCN